MNEHIQALIDRKIKKLQQLRDLLADPEMVELVHAMFFPNAPSKVAAGVPSTQLELPRPRRNYQRRGGSLLEQTYKHLREYGEQTTAKELADFMKSSGYKFKAKDPNIAVSKALRLLADSGTIKSERGEHAKAAIVYWAPQPDPLQTPSQIPVQVETTH